MGIFQIGTLTSQEVIQALNSQYEEPELKRLQEFSKSDYLPVLAHGKLIMLDRGIFGFFEKGWYWAFSFLDKKVVLLDRSSDAALLIGAVFLKAHSPYPNDWVREEAEQSLAVRLESSSFLPEERPLLFELRHLGSLKTLAGSITEEELSRLSDNELKMLLQDPPFVASLTDDKILAITKTASSDCYEEILERVSKDENPLQFEVREAFKRYGEAHMLDFPHEKQLSFLVQCGTIAVDEAITLLKKAQGKLGLQSVEFIVKKTSPRTLSDLDACFAKKLFHIGASFWAGEDPKRAILEKCIAYGKPFLNCTSEEIKALDAVVSYALMVQVLREENPIDQKEKELEILFEGLMPLSAVLPVTMRAYIIEKSTVSFLSKIQDMRGFLQNIRIKSQIQQLVGYVEVLPLKVQKVHDVYEIVVSKEKEEFLNGTRCGG